MSHSRVCGAVAETNVVQAGSSRPTTPPNHPGSSPLIPFTPPKDITAFKERLEPSIASFEKDLRRRFKFFLESDVQLPLWQPPDADQIHIARLEIPVISPLSEAPSLLLHNLGRPSHDAELEERVANLFKLQHG